MVCSGAVVSARVGGLTAVKKPQDSALPKSPALPDVRGATVTGGIIFARPIVGSAFTPIGSDRHQCVFCVHGNGGRIAQ